MELLDLADCPATRLFLARPECFHFESDFLLMPNPAYYDYDAAVESPAGYARKVLRRGLGFGLVAWYVHPELRKRARFFRCHPDLRVASRLIGEAAPPSPLPSPRRGVPSPPSPSGRPRTGSFDYAVVSKPPPAPILLGSPSFVARRAAASPRAPSPRNAPATPTAAARTLAPTTPTKLVESPVYVGDVLGSSADAVPYFTTTATCGPSTRQNLKRWKPPFGSTCVPLTVTRQRERSGRTVSISTGSTRSTPNRTARGHSQRTPTSPSAGPARRRATATRQRSATWWRGSALRLQRRRRAWNARAEYAERCRRVGRGAATPRRRGLLGHRWSTLVRSVMGLAFGTCTCSRPRLALRL